MAEIQKVKADLKSSFKMKDLAEAMKILGINIQRDRGCKRLWIFQSDYIKKVLKKFNIDNAKAATTPLSESFNHLRSRLLILSKRHRIWSLFLMLVWLGV